MTPEDWSTICNDLDYIAYRLLRLKSHLEDLGKDTQSRAQRISRELDDAGYKL